jgi:hypothetical protein
MRLAGDGEAVAYEGCRGDGSLIPLYCLVR